MRIDPYLMFKGNCREAFTFYEQLLGGRIEAMLTHRETPAAEHTEPEWQDKILHACLMIGDQMLMASDAPPQFHSDIKGASVSLAVDTPEEAERIFNGLAEGAAVSMPLGETFFAQKFGMLTDRFGVPWMVNCPPKQ